MADQYHIADNEQHNIDDQDRIINIDSDQSSTEADLTELANDPEVFFNML